MAKLTGSAADVYICAGAGTPFTGEACTLVSGTTYQITDTGKRIWDLTTAVVVYDGLTTVPDSDYELVYGTGKIILAAAPAGAVTVTGAYLTASQFGQAHKWSGSFGPNLQDTPTFGDGWETKSVTSRKGSITLDRFYSDDYFHDNLGAPFLLVLYHKQSSGQRYVAVGHMDSNSIETARDAIIGESVSFQTTGWVDYSAT